MLASNPQKPVGCPVAHIIIRDVGNAHKRTAQNPAGIAIHIHIRAARSKRSERATSWAADTHLLPGVCEMAKDSLSTSNDAMVTVGVIYVRTALFYACPPTCTLGLAHGSGDLEANGPLLSAVRHDFKSYLCSRQLHSARPHLPFLPLHSTASRKMFGAHAMGAQVVFPCGIASCRFESVAKLVPECMPETCCSPSTGLWFTISLEATVKLV